MVALHPKRVLVPTDFSDEASRAVDDGLALVETPEQLTVVHVAPSMVHWEGDPIVDSSMPSDESRADHLRKVLHKKFADKKYEKVRFEVLFGSPAREIARFAENDGTELIVLPSHGRTGRACLMIGSVAEHVVRLAHCPVLVLRD